MATYRFMAELLPDSPLTLRVKCSGTVQSMPWNNLFYIGYTSGTPTNADCGALAASLSTLWNTTWAAAFPATSQLRQVTVWDLASRQGGSGFSTAVHPGTRTGTTNLPPNCAGVVSWVVQQRWRGGHFRSYIPLGYAADVTGTLLATTVQTALVTAATNWKNGINGLQFLGASAVMMSVRYFHDRHQPFNPPQKLPILDGVVHGRMDSMRRRLGKEVYT